MKKQTLKFGWLPVLCLVTGAVFFLENQGQCKSLLSQDIVAQKPYCSECETFNLSDTDGDGIMNMYDYDLDNDGIPNDQDPDMDDNGIPNEEQCNGVYGCNAY